MEQIMNNQTPDRPYDKHRHGLALLIITLLGSGLVTTGLSWAVYLSGRRTAGDIMTIIAICLFALALLVIIRYQRR
jgi:hypothetical protein